MSWILRIVVFMVLALQSAAAAEVRPYIVFDVNSGEVLQADEPFMRWYPASLTKLMTSYVTFKALKEGTVTLKSPVVMSKNAASEPPTKMGYKPGTVMTLENALRMMLVKSANDISVAIAETIGGSESGFVGRMNNEAQALGMTGTHFTNPNGLFSRNNYSNARDLAVLTAALRNEFPEYARFFSIEALSFGKIVRRSYNTMLGRFDGADGMKTGFVCESGFNLVATATRKGQTIGAVVLGADSSVERAEKAADLLAKGFSAEADGEPVLSTMKPFGDLETVTNLRSEICARKARSGRRTRRDKNGHIIFNTKNLHPMYNAPVAIAVSLGGATGVEGTFIEHAAIPVPTPRPKDVPVAELTGVPPAASSDAADGGGGTQSNTETPDIAVPPPSMTLPPFPAALPQ